MKSLLAGLVLVSFIFNANAAFTRIAGNNFATDDATGLDWLALSETRNQIYNNAESLYTGWRYATNSEVTTMFTTLFPGYASENSYGYSYTYATIIDEVATFQSLFGFSGLTGTYVSYGFYLDESNILRMLGATSSNSNEIVYGTNFFNDLTANLTTPNSVAGTYMVRTTVPVSGSTPVSESASLYLLAFGLLGLLTVARRKT